MTHNNQEERSVEELDEIQRLIVEKDPDDNDKFLRQLWDLVAQAKETFHHQLQKAREEERERIFEAIDDFFIGPNIILDGGVLKGYIREAIHSELDQDKALQDNK